MNYVQNQKGLKPGKVKGKIEKRKLMPKSPQTMRMENARSGARALLLFHYLFPHLYN